MATNEVVVGAYGAGGASGRFDPIFYIKKPEVILRLFGVLFSIIVFGVISDKGWVLRPFVCVYNENADACNFGIAIGVISFLGLLALLVADGFFDVLSNANYRKYIVIADVCYSSVWAFMWLVCFAFLTDQWRITAKVFYINVDAAQAALAFAFFSLLIYIALVVLAVLKYRQGVVLGVTGQSSSASPPPYSEPSMPPSGAGSVYSVGDTQFSPHPFSSGPAAGKFPPSTDQPAY